MRSLPKNKQPIQNYYENIISYGTVKFNNGCKTYAAVFSRENRLGTRPSGSEPIYYSSFQTSFARLNAAHAFGQPA